VDRCALFVDAGYVLADGAMAVHGTRQRGSVSWDYAGLVKLLTGLARDRTGLPVLRCYWYEATVEGRRSDEHDVLADLPGVKLRLGRVRPGRREGVEAGIHRDLTTLARNRAVSDAVVVSAEEDLADVVAEVQDLGLRVVVVHIAADGSWTASGPLRQECDDAVQISAAHLRPFVDLIAAAEPSDQQEEYRNGSYQQRGMTNGHAGGFGAMTHQGLPAAALPPAPQIYTTPVVEDYQRSSAGAGQAPAPAQAARAPQPQPAPRQQGPAGTPGADGLAGPAQEQARPQHDAAALPPAQGMAQPQTPAYALAEPQPSAQAPAQPEFPAQPQAPPQHQLPAEPAAVSHALTGQAHDLSPATALGPPPQGQHAAAALDGQRFPGTGERQAPEAAQPQSPGRQQPQPPVPAQPVAQAPAAAQSQAPVHGHGRGQPAQVPAQSAAPAAAQSQALPPAHAAPAPGPPVQEPGAQLPVRQAPVAAQPLPAPTPPPGYGPGPDASWPPQEAVSSAGRQEPPGPQQPQAGQSGTRFAPGQGDYRPPGQMGPTHNRFGELPAAQRFDGPSAGRFAELPPAQPRFGDGAPPGRFAEAPGSARYADSPGQSRFAEGPPAARYGDGAGSSAYQPGQPDAFGPGQTPYPPQYPGPQPGQHAGSGPEPSYLPSPREQGAYNGPQSGAHAALPQPVPQPMAMSLSDAVQAAHAEGFGFGDAVARDAPALWLEAVLARKPRMPSDLEARLLQGSALPIDSLLHDEVRHSLRRGFWDALERSRR
jgi:hypothetical protein